MELNKDSNNEYKKDKQAFEKVKHLEKEMKILSDRLKVVKRAIEDAETAKRRAIEDNNEKGRQKAEQKIKSLEERKQKIRRRGKKVEETLNNAQDKVQEHFKEIEKDPELKAHIDKAMAVKYNRQLNKVHKEQAQLETLRKVMEEKPEIENNLKGMIRANEKIEALKEELEGLDAIKDKARIDEIKLKEIPEAESKYKINKDMMMKRVNVKQENDTDKKVEITSEFIDTLAQKRFSHHKVDGKDFKKGDIDLNKTLNKIAKGYANKEAFYNQVIQKVTGNEQKTQEGVLNKIKNKINGNKTESEKSLIVVDKKISWRHPIKKFKAWWKNRDKNNEEISEEENKNKIPKKNISDKFKRAYKYDIIRDYVDNKEQEMREEFKQTRKNNQERDSDESR